MKKMTIALALFFIVFATNNVSNAQSSDKRRSVPFVNIAPGEIKNDLIKKMPVKMMFLSESGKIYGGVYVRIYNESGIAIFKRLCEKPWLYLNLPAGDYNVIAIDRKQVKRILPFHVSKNPDKQTVLKLKWPVETVGY